MKFNLKNRPINGENCGWDDFIPKAEEWFEGFEKELRKALEFEEQQAKKSDREQSMVAHFQIDLIKEILGE
jgi:hypothetical protein